jgi:hypothetical protein
MKLIYEFNISPIPNYYVIGRKKRYTSMNLFYSNTHWSVRKGIVDKAKATLKTHINPKMFIRKAKSLHISYIYESKRNSFDIENRLGFWSKVFLDFVKGTRTIPDDNVKTVKSVSYEYNHHNQITDNLKIKVYDLSSKGDPKE